MTDDTEIAMDQLRAEVEKLKKDRATLEDENHALAIRAEGVQVLSRVLEQTQQEAAVLREKLARHAGAESSKSDAGDIGSPGKSKKEGKVSLGGSLNSIDVNALHEIQKELHSLLEKNQELTLEIESTLDEQSMLSGDAVDHLNRLRFQLDSYQTRMQGQGDWPKKLKEEAARLKNKLTDIAIRRGNTCGKLQEEIDSVKLRLRDLESRIPPTTTPTTTPHRNDTDTDILRSPRRKMLHDAELVLPASNYPEQQPALSTADVESETMEGNPTGNLPAVKPRTDVKVVKETLKKVTDENEGLRIQMETLKAEKNEIIKVNHSWEAQYKKLQDHCRKEMKAMDDSYYKLQRQFSQEHRQSHATVRELLDQKDALIDNQGKKIRELQDSLSKCNLESVKINHQRMESDLEAKYQQARKKFLELKRDKDILVQREESYKEENQMLNDAVNVLERESKSLVERNKMLTEEIQRLANVIDSSASRSRSSPPSLMYPGAQGSGRENISASDEQIEVFKQQIAIYVEDFKSEKEEKEKLVDEVEKLKANLAEAKKKVEDLQTQLKGKDDIYSGREGRFQQMKMLGDIYQDMYDPYVGGYMNQRPNYAAEQMRKYEEYRQLLSERTRIGDRLTELERMGADRYPVRISEPLLNQDVIGRGASPLGASAQNNSESKTENDMFTGGLMVRDKEGSPKLRDNVDVLRR